MSLDIDGFAVFAAIGANRDLFADLAEEIDKAARTLVVKQIKRKTFDLAGLRALRSSLGAEMLALIFDGLSEAEIGSVLAKCDKHNAELKSGSNSWRRSHLDALASGEIEAAPAAKTKSGKKPKAGPPTTNAPATSKTQDVKAGLTYASAGRVRKLVR